MGRCSQNKHRRLATTPHQEQFSSSIGAATPSYCQLWTRQFSLLFAIEGLRDPNQSQYESMPTIDQKAQLTGGDAHALPYIKAL